jgi:large repetitive protein
VMGVQGGPRDVWISYGAAGLSAMATPIQVPIPATAVATGIYDFAIGNAGELAAATTRLRDVLLADPTWRSNRGRYLLYFGRLGGTTIDPIPVEFRGTAAGSNATVPAGSANDIGFVRIVPDFGSSGGGLPDGFDEVFISANAENGGNGVAYLFYGRSIEGWQALQTATDATDPGLPYIPMSAADRVFSGEAPPPCPTCTPTPPGSMFSVRRGYVGLGDINADGVPEFTIPDARDFVNKLYVFSGAAINASPTAVSASSALEILQEVAPASPPPVGALNGYASDALGNVRLFGGKDLAVGYPAVDKVLLYRQQGTGFVGAPTITITGGGRFGNTLAVGDINADGRPDLIVGTNNNVSGGGILTGGWIMYNTGVAGAEYDTRWAEGVHQSRVLKDPNDSSTPNAMGISVAAGDFNKDGLVDIAVADHRSGTGKVYIRY